MNNFSPKFLLFVAQWRTSQQKFRFFRFSSNPVEKFFFFSFIHSSISKVNQDEWSFTVYLNCNLDLHKPRTHHACCKHESNPQSNVHKIMSNKHPLREFRVAFYVFMVRVPSPFVFSLFLYLCLDFS